MASLAGFASIHDHYSDSSGDEAAEEWGDADDQDDTQAAEVFVKQSS
jgi:hypothetical protein